MSVVKGLHITRQILYALKKCSNLEEFTGYSLADIDDCILSMERAIKHYESESKRVRSYGKRR